MARTALILLQGNLLALAYTFSAFAGIEASSIPRKPLAAFRAEGLFEGGSEAKANLEALRFFEHKSQGYERWVVDFSDLKKTVGAVAPRFQIQYLKSERGIGPEGTEVLRKPAKFIFIFRSIARNELSEPKLQALAKKSQHVEKILLYPPIEGGDMAMEFILKEDVEFQPHQPLEKEGRLVLDIRHRG